MTPTQTETRSQHAATIEIADLDRDVFDAKQDEHLDAATLEAAFKSLLALYPDAPVAAHSADAMIVAMPESVPLLNNPVLKARSGADLAVYDEHMARGWERVIAEGAARYPVHPVGYPDLTSMVYGLDRRGTHGVLVILAVVAATDGVERQAAREIPKVTPRFARMRKDNHAVITDIDEATTQLLGWTPGEMIGERGSEFMHPDDRPLAVDNWLEMLASPGPGRRVRLPHRREDKSWVWFEVTNHNLLDDPDYGCVVSEIVDVSEEMAAHELLDGLARAIPVGLFQVYTNRQIVYTNGRLHEILGVEPEDTLEAQLATVKDADRAALSLVEVRVAKGTIAVRVSIGVAWTSGEEADADAMVAMADHAMYESKREGAGRPKLASAVARLTLR